MKHPFGASLLALLATSSIAMAGGTEEGDKAKANKGENTRSLTRLAATPQESGPRLHSAAAGEGFTIAGDDFALTVSNRVQVLYRFSAFETAQDNSNFSINRARTQLEGHVWDEDLTYRFMVDWAGGRADAAPGNVSRIKDAWFRYVFFKGEDGNTKLAARVGAQKPYHGKEFEGIAEGMVFTERSLTSRTFSGQLQVGFFLEGVHGDGGMFHWAAGIADGDVAIASASNDSGENAPNTDNRMTYYFDLRVDPWGDLGGEGIGSSPFVQGDLGHTEDVKGSFGVGFMYGNHIHPTIANPGGTFGENVETTSINVNTAWKYRGFSALGEVFIRTDDTQGTGNPESDHNGFNVAASYTMAKPDTGPQWGGALRYSFVTNDDATSALFGPNPLTSPLGGAQGDQWEVGAAINAFYHEHALKTQIGYTFQRLDPDAVGATEVDNHFIDVLFQWMF